LTGKCEITTQNHGFGIDPEAIRKVSNVEITHINLNDDSIEGHPPEGQASFSVQYHPKARPAHTTAATFLMSLSISSKASELIRGIYLFSHS